MRDLCPVHPSFCKNDSAIPPHGACYATVQQVEGPEGVIEIGNKQTSIATRPSGRAPSFLRMTGFVAVQQECLA